VTLKQSLIAARNPDGGWPYYAGKTSRLEPTVWAMLALDAAGERVSLDPLLAWPRRDSWFVDRSSDAVNVCFNALTAIGLAALAPDAPSGPALAAALVTARGVKLPQSPTNVQDNALQGWAWIDGTFSWVEPTAMAVIALTRHRALSGAQARISEGQRLLLDRTCSVGGWNYGNANVLGRQLEPHTPQTALALMALRDRRDTDAAKRSQQYLTSHALDERSGLALALTRVALGVVESPASTLAHALVEQWTRSAFLGNLHVTALALYAEAAEAGGYEAFRV
jgi:hypothetical protein